MLFTTLFSQTPLISNAEEAGIANASVTNEGISAIFHNPAGINAANIPAIGFYHESPYLTNKLNTRTVAGVLPIKNGSFGSSYSYYGTVRYNEQKLGLAYAHSLGNSIDAGILIDLYTVKLPDDYNTDHALSGEIGIIVRPINHLSIGAHVNNVSNANYKLYYNARLPAFFQIGLTWDVDKYMLSAKTQINTYNNTVISVGTEMRLVKNLDLRLGISSDKKMSYAFGMGFKQKWWRSDIAFTKHPTLGFSSYLSIEIHLATHKK
jgi:hypothetical protein